MSIVAIDVGLKRIGVSLCVHSDIITPLEAVQRKNRNQAAAQVDKILDEWQADILVVGIPKEGSSAEEMGRRIRHFVSLLNFKKEIVFVEEDFSSYEAKELMKGEIKEKRDGRVDSIAAGFILKRYLSA
ncbi:MAG: Holliday junction resolvase RuvX [Campylobacteraceae bacterium]|nr:Holliday junction resolvase RuvX [Campylobacteraceae bacterium]